ncbi:MAG: twin-arginine translocase subunit TatC [Planctomycetota bacterium]|jgi:sec-independent protein translocase protein TatC
MTERDAGRMTIAEHLDELRKRLLVSVVAVVFCAILAFWRIEDVVNFMRRPLDLAITDMTADTVHVVQTKVFGGFLAAMKVAFFAGAVIASPVVLMQMWGFISAGLYRHERRAVKFYAIPGFLLFLSGAALAYFYVMPYAFDFLLGFSEEQLGIESMLDISPLISLMAFAMFMFGLLFQLPVVMVFMMRIGVVEPDTFARYRRHAIAASFALAMVLTPPDIVTQIALAVSMAILYEAAIWFGRFIAQPRTEQTS